MATGPPNSDPWSDSADSSISHPEKTLLDRREFLFGTVAGATAIAITTVNPRVAGGLTEHSTPISTNPALLSQIQYQMPAVDGNGDGQIIGLTASLSDGDGGIYVNLKDIEVRHNLQLAIQEATVTARRVTGISLNGRDLHLSFSPPGNERVTLWGKSWETGLTVTLISILAKRDLLDGVLATGIISKDGRLLPVGDIEAKAIAARKFGANKLLVPPGQDAEVDDILVEDVASITEVMGQVFQ